MQELVGYMAACLTTVAFVPQAYKIYKTNQTNSARKYKKLFCQHFMRHNLNT